MKWLPSFTMSFALHLVIIIILILFKPQPMQPTKTKTQEAKIVKSYLYSSPTKVPEQKTKTKKMQSKTSNDEGVKAITEITIKQETKEMPHDSRSEPPKDYSNKPLNTHLPRVNTSELLNNFRKQLSNSNNNLWKQHQIDSVSKFSSLTNFKTKLSIESYKALGQPFVTNISGLKEVAISGDGSRYIKLGSKCFLVKVNQHQETHWTNSTCPSSADTDKQLLKQSLNKYLPKLKP